MRGTFCRNFDHSHVLLSFLYPVKGGYGEFHIYIQTITCCYPFKVPTLINHIHTACWLLNLQLTFNNRSFSAMDMFADAMYGYVLRTHTHVSQRLTGQAFTIMHPLKAQNKELSCSLDHVLLPQHLILFPPLFWDAFCL